MYYLVPGKRLLAIAGLWILLSQLPCSSLAQANGAADCSRFAGRDAGEKIQACLNSLSSGGIADARGLTGQQVIGRSIQITHNGTVLLFGPVSSFTLADDAVIDVSATEVRVAGEGNTTVFRLGNRSAVRIGTTQQPIWGWHLERIAIMPATGKTPTAGLLLNNAREGFIDQVTLSGFPGTAVDIGDGCWSDRAIDTRVIKNDVGYNFHGDQINAWNIRGGMINSNRVGVNFELGAGLLQGFSFSDSVQMESNTSSAIRLASGELRGIFLSQVYSEIFASQKLISFEPSGQSLKVSLLSVANSYVYSKDTPPIMAATRSQDFANVKISNVVLRHSQQDLPIASASGPNSSIVLSDSHSYSGAGTESKAPLAAKAGAHIVVVRGDSENH
jgi:hypothetical protein